jgi:hypothetical protein
VLWLNQILAKKNLKIAKFPDDLHDGTLLATICESLTGKSLGRLDAAKFEVHKIGNVTKSLKAFEEDGMKV